MPAKLVGKKVTATVGCALEGIAFATLADATVAAVAPITFEAEAEKPMRASRAKKDVALVAGPAEILLEEDAEEEAEDTLVESDDLSESDSEPASEGEAVAAADAAPKKKRTRRGTRGGRARKKPAAGAATGEGESDAPAGQREGNSRAAPKIHVPPAELAPTADVVEPTDAATEAQATEPATDGDPDAPPKRKRARRGSRGGKKRRKPAANGDTDAATADTVVPVEAIADDGPPEYVPMSEWIDDFEARSRG